MFDYDKETQSAAKVIDKYDLSGYLESCYLYGPRDPWDIREHIASNSIPFEMDLFDALHILSTDEFIEYLEKRYDVQFEEIISYQMRKPKFMKG